jgi:hypothetical protein
MRRATLGLSQRRADMLMGWRATTIRGWEQGARPYAKSWPEIIRFLGYDPRPPVQQDAAAD